MKLAVGAGLALALVAMTCAAPHAPEPPVAQPATSVWLEAANGAATWLAQNSLDTEHGLGWRADPSSALEVDRTLYAGSPGVVLFFLELAHATGNPDALAFARAGCEDLLANLPEHVEGESAGLYTGIAGVGYAIGETWRATDDDRYRLGLERALDILIADSHVDPVEQHGVSGYRGNARWGSCSDVISGTAGIGFIFHWARAHRRRACDTEMCACAGMALVAVADSTADGYDWAMDATFPRRMPNFSHGTAGIAALLAQISISQRMGSGLEKARGGAEHLIAIADRSNGGFQVGHDTPDNPQLMYMGWCHGPCGTARLFRELFVATKDEKWRELELACAKSVMASGLPEQRLPGFWNNVSRCCGGAGVIEFMLDLYDETHDAQYLEFARRVGRDLLARATRDEHGMRWIQAENRTQPDNLVAQTGLMQGAAGIGLALVHLDEVERGIERSIRLPDEPPR